MKEPNIDEYLSEDTNLEDTEDTMKEVEKNLKNEDGKAEEAGESPAEDAAPAPAEEPAPAKAPALTVADEGYKPRPLYQSGLFWSIVAGLLVVVLMLVICNKVREKKADEAASTTTTSAVTVSETLTSVRDADANGAAASEGSTEAAQPAPLTMDQFSSIKPGQDYWTVRDVFGYDGNTTSMVEEDGVRVTHVNWTSGAQKIEVVFHDGLVYSVSEAGL